MRAKAGKEMIIKENRDESEKKIIIVVIQHVR
jgi:hypothetical protein